MKKQSIVVGLFTIFCFLLTAWVPCQANDVLYGCVNSKNGKLRIVTQDSLCKDKEYPVTLSGSSQQQPSNMTLRCYTAVLLYEVEGAPDYCNDTYYLGITSPAMSIVIPGIFEVFCEAPSSFTDDDVMWGLRCQEGWVNTGCAESSFSVSGELDIPQFQNGCHSDDETYGNGNIFTTCCKIEAAK